jgi:hypothetical protein
MAAFKIGDIVTYANHEDEDAPRGRLIQREPDAGDERTWLVA